MSEERCICCGDVIPEGRLVCKKCELTTNKPNTTILDEVQYLKRDFENCTSSEEVKLIREWNKAIDECIKVVAKYV